MSVTVAAGRRTPTLTSIELVFSLAYVPIHICEQSVKRDGRVVVVRRRGAAKFANGMKSAISQFALAAAVNGVGGRDVTPNFGLVR